MLSFSRKSISYLTRSMQFISNTFVIPNCSMHETYLKWNKVYTSSITRADAPPPPLQTPPTPYFPFFCFSTYKSIMKLWKLESRITTINTNRSARPYDKVGERAQHIDAKVAIQKILQNKEAICHSYTPNSVTKIRAPLHPRGCPKDTAPPCTLTFSWKSK